MFNEEILLTIFVAAVTALVTSLARDFLSFAIKKSKIRISKVRWKRKIPKDYIDRDLIISLKQDSTIELLNEAHRVKGLAGVTQEGESLFEFCLEANGKERWLDFDHGKTSLWGKWNDPNLWGKSVRNGKEPFPIKLDEIKNIQKINAVDVVMTALGISSEVKTFWGRWGRKHSSYSVLNYNIAVFQLTNLKKDGRKLYICLESSAGQKVLYDFYIGIELKNSDIKIA